MKLPFRSSSEADHDPAEEYEDGGLDTVGLASGDLSRSILGAAEDESYRRAARPDDAYGDYEEYGEYDDGYEQGYDYHEGYDDDHGYHEPGRRPGRGRSSVLGRGRRRSRDRIAATGEGPVVSADTFADNLERYRSEASREQRTAWAYLGVLGVMFVTLSLLGWACGDTRQTDVAPDRVAEGGAASNTVELQVDVDGDTVTLEGPVPDEAARTQVLDLARASYGENVVDELEVREGVSFEDGTVRFSGMAEPGDQRPQALHQAVLAQFGLADDGYQVTVAEAQPEAVAASIQVTETQAILSGALPDEQSVTDLTGLAAEVFGPEAVEASGLTVGDTSWTEGVITISGAIGASDPRVLALVEAAPQRLGAPVSVDTSSLPQDDDPAVIADVQTTVAELVLAEPIQFAQNSTEIQGESDAVLVQVAELLNQVPGTPFEVVGHTDSIGPEEDNLEVSEERAAVVAERLVELGVSQDRISSRGEGEVNPIADNGTDAGRATNRRIEFILLGGSDGG